MSSDLTPYKGHRLNYMFRDIIIDDNMSDTISVGIDVQLLYILH